MPDKMLRWVTGRNWAEAVIAAGADQSRAERQQMVGSGLAAFESESWIAEGKFIHRS
jgi:hypothetical protein